jgi:hypothetical protein
MFPTIFKSLLPCMTGPPYQGVGEVYPASPQIIVDLDHMCFQVFIKISTLPISLLGLH